MSIVGLGGPAGSQDLPSNKLFFAGLPPSLTEETFRAMMEKFPGFEAARLRHDRAGQWVGFVDFTEETEATACKNAMGGAKLDPNNAAQVTVRYSGAQNKPQPRPGMSGGMPGMGLPPMGGQLSGAKRAFEPSFEPPPPHGPPPGWTGPMGGGFDGPMGPGGVPMPAGPPPGMMGGPMNGDAPLPPGPPPGMLAANATTPLPSGPPPGVGFGDNRFLIVEGVPKDGTVREVTQLFRFLPGFVGVSEAEAPDAATAGDEPAGAAEGATRYRVEFTYPSDASGAIGVRQGLVFDPAQPTTTLRVGFAPQLSA